MLRIWGNSISGVCSHGAKSAGNGMNTTFWEALQLGIVQFLQQPRPEFKCQLYIFCCVNVSKFMKLSNLQFPHLEYENSNRTQLTRLLCR